MSGPEHTHIDDKNLNGRFENGGDWHAEGINEHDNNKETRTPDSLTLHQGGNTYLRTFNSDGTPNATKIKDGGQYKDVPDTDRANVDQKFDAALTSYRDVAKNVNPTAAPPGPAQVHTNEGLGEEIKHKNRTATSAQDREKFLGENAAQLAEHEAELKALDKKLKTILGRKHHSILKGNAVDVEALQKDLNAAGQKVGLTEKLKEDKKVGEKTWAGVNGALKKLGIHAAP